MVFVGYFAILNNCSSIILSEGLISGEKVGIIMSFQTVSSLVTGLYIGKLKKLLGRYMGTFIWLCSIGGLLSLYAKNSLALTMLGLVLFGIALARQWEPLTRRRVLPVRGMSPWRQALSSCS